VHSVETGSGRSIVTLHVRGLVPGRGYGAHVHVGACSDNKGRGHYLHDPAGGANPHNEVWLDLTANPAGNAHAKADVAWTFRPGQANSVVIHDRHTDVTGAAGAKLACLDASL
jgi:Cu-Zn family superoxide dismutase